MTTTSELKPLLKRFRLGYLLNILRPNGLP